MKVHSNQKLTKTTQKTQTTTQTSKPDTTQEKCNQVDGGKIAGTLAARSLPNTNLPRITPETAQTHPATTTEEKCNAAIKKLEDAPDGTIVHVRASGIASKLVRTATHGPISHSAFVGKDKDGKKVIYDSIPLAGVRKLEISDFVQKNKNSKIAMQKPPKSLQNDNESNRLTEFAEDKIQKESKYNTGGGIRSLAQLKGQGQKTKENKYFCSEFATSALTSAGYLPEEETRNPGHYSPTRVAYKAGKSGYSQAENVLNGPINNLYKTIDNGVNKTYQNEAKRIANSEQQANIEACKKGTIGGREAAKRN